MAASIEIAGRENGYPAKVRERIVRHAMRSYRETMQELASVPMMSVWYAHLNVEEILPRFSALLDPKKTPNVWKAINKARAHDSHQAFNKLCYDQDGETKIIHDPPLIVPVENFTTGVDPRVTAEALAGILRSYTESLEPELRHLLAQHEYAHMARKVVGVGSVGTEAWIALFLSLEDDSPLFLQVKEAQPRSSNGSRRERILQPRRACGRGQRLMQAASDIFLGWLRFAWDGTERDYYFRQLRDWKGSVDVEGMTPAGMDVWGRMCGWTLARAHARTGDRVVIASYLGKSERFDLAVTDSPRRTPTRTNRIRRAGGSGRQRENRGQHRGLTTASRRSYATAGRWRGGDPFVGGRRVAPVPDAEHAVGDRAGGQRHPVRGQPVRQRCQQGIAGGDAGQHQQPGQARLHDAQAAGRDRDHADDAGDRIGHQHQGGRGSTAGRPQRGEEAEVVEGEPAGRREARPATTARPGRLG